MNIKQIALCTLIFAFSGITVAHTYQFKPMVRKLIAIQTEEMNLELIQPQNQNPSSQLYFAIQTSAFEAIGICMDHNGANDIIIIKKCLKLILPKLQEEALRYCINDEMKEMADASFSNLNKKINTIGETGMSAMPEGGLGETRKAQYTITDEMQNSITKPFSNLDQMIKNSDSLKSNS